MENTNEIMVNEEVMEVAPEVVTQGSGKVGETIVKIGLVALVGFTTYKLGKFIYTKVKAAKERKRAAMEADDIDELDDCEDIESDSE